MKIDKDGKLDYFSKQTFQILSEFEWNIEDLADEIIKLREELNDIATQ